VTWFEQNVPVEDDSLPPVLDVEGDADLGDLPPPSRARFGHRRHEGDAGRDGAPLRAPARHLYHVDFYEAILAGGAFTDYPIWVRSTKHHPAVRYGSRQWHFWQFQSDGYTPGIQGHVDRTPITARRRNGRRSWDGPK